MSFLESYRLELELLSPVHLGTGETFPAYAYVPDPSSRTVHILDPSLLLLHLSPERRRTFLAKVAEGPKGAQEVLQYLYQEGQIPKEAILRSLPASKAFLDTVLGAHQEALLEFRPLPYSPMGAYLPGSSVKGALRTAWLFWSLVQKGEDLVFRGGVWEFRRSKGEVRVNPPRSPRLGDNQVFEGVVLGYATLKERGYQLDLYKDPFRAVRLTDSSPAEGFLNRIGIHHPLGKMDGTVVLAETFRMGSRFQFLFRYQGGLARHRGVAGAIPPRELVRALREYYGRVAEWERSYAEEHGLGRALEVYGELERRLKDPEVFPIRVGYGSGRLALRLALLLPEDHPEGQEPKTRKTVGALRPKDGYPLGWTVGRLVPVA
ncbi:type III-A CRISPR-associated RAMP protein Csm5 [Thermus sp. SYSU G05001]|uniref:CRISPR system Cms protein Csm5 n=1 Tax=Thermus brevis TaxID=2862456 RepID=A0ABS6ZX87_9DEIN|nr:type III-A CRISPR-associated RAMP protein Csm5 [Thermus brevis]MBW6394677.1 type III-A CRISPR-associated RAMP protein Csm5 [Thermus brevis]